MGRQLLDREPMFLFAANHTIIAIIGIADIVTDNEAASEIRQSEIAGSSWSIACHCNRNSY